jgi:NitT/TauT family transport system permease protein
MIRRRNALRAELDSGQKMIISVVGTISFLTLWCVFTYTGWISHQIIPTPTEVLGGLKELSVDGLLIKSAIASLYRVFMGNLLAALVAFPLGVAMGSYPQLKAFFEPITGPGRYLPIAALVPVTILWFGITDLQKIMLLFIGTVVYLLPLIVEAIENVEEVYKQTAETLGASSLQIIRHIFIPIGMPSIFEALRVMNGIGWTYIILAEVINAEFGLGHLIQLSQKRGRIEDIFALVIVITIIGIITDKIFIYFGKMFFSWKEEVHG